MDVKTILKSKGNHVSTVGPHTLVAEVVQSLKNEGIGAVVVIDTNGGVLGVVSERSVVLGLAHHGPKLLEQPVAELVSGSVKTCAPDDNIKRLMTEMTTHRARHLPVVDQGRLCGLISIGDVVKSRIEEAELETEVLRDAYITHGARAGY